VIGLGLVPLRALDVLAGRHFWCSRPLLGTSGTFWAADTGEVLSW